MRFAELASLYQRDHSEVVKTDGGLRDRQALKNILPVLGNINIESIDTADINSYRNHRIKSPKKSRGRGNISPGTVNRELAIIGSILNWGMSMGHCKPLRSIRIQKMRDRTSSYRILDSAEESVLLTALRRHQRPIIRTALLTGMRIGEILGLQKGDIDWSLRVIKLTRTKNNRSRVIPISPKLEKILRVAWDNPSIFIFTYAGRPIKSINHGFRSAVTRAGVAPIRIHDLRHTAATRMLLAGVDVITIKEILGHSSLEMVMRYAHSTDEAKKKAVEIL